MDADGPVILVVEDDDFIRELSEMTIQDWGYHTLSASDESEAMSHIRSNVQIDVLFTDVYIKARQFGGCHLATEAVKLRPELHVIYTTGNFISADIEKMFIAGSHFLAKPYLPGKLHALLKSMVAA